MDLKPCPFCGSQELEMVHETGKDRYEELVQIHWVHCKGCTASGPMARFSLEAVEEWNRRKPLTT